MSDLKDSFVRFAIIVSDFDATQALDGYFLHLAGDRVITLAGQACVDARILD